MSTGPDLFQSPLPILGAKSWGLCQQGIGELYTPKFRYIQCEAPKIAKLVYNSKNYGLWYL